MRLRSTLSSMVSLMSLQFASMRRLAALKSVTVLSASLQYLHRVHSVSSGRSHPACCVHASLLSRGEHSEGGPAG